MATRSHFALVVLSVLTTAALASTAASARPGQGQGPRSQPSAPLAQEVDQVGSAAVSVDTPEVTVETSATEEQESLLLHGSVAQDSAESPQNLPSGLQRRIDNRRGLPSGLQRQVYRGRDLPPGLNR
ncbi:MAG: hypothetical protein WBG32_00975 [Nodosilinea sp.]